MAITPMQIGNAPQARAVPPAGPSTIPAPIPAPIPTNAPTGAADGGRPVAPALSADDWKPEEAQMSFWDFLDIINPLQHIPIVGDIYRSVTGDTIQASSRAMGGILFGGPIGGAVAVVNAIIENETGQTMGGAVMASLGLETGGTPPEDTASQVARNAPPAEQPAGDAPPATVTPATATDGDPAGGPPPPPATVAAKTGAPATVAAKTGAPAVPQPLPRDQIADAMMRGLEKYEEMSRRAERAATRTLIDS